MTVSKNQLRLTSKEIQANISLILAIVDKAIEVKNISRLRLINARLINIVSDYEEK